MNKKLTKNLRILAIAPSTSGLGFAFFNGPSNLAGCGVKTIKGDKNAQSLIHVREKIKYYRPDVLVLEDALAEDSRRLPRVRKLYGRILKSAADQKLPVETLSRKEWRRLFFTEGEGTKQEMAELLAKRFPAELGPILPPTRELWMSEDYQMPVFDAVALGLAYWFEEER